MFSSFLFWKVYWQACTRKEACVTGDLRPQACAMCLPPSENANSVFLKSFYKICGVCFLIIFNYAPIELVQTPPTCLSENPLCEVRLCSLMGTIYILKHLNTGLFCRSSPVWQNYCHFNFCISTKCPLSVITDVICVCEFIKYVISLNTQAFQEIHPFPKRCYDSKLPIFLIHKLFQSWGTRMYICWKTHPWQKDKLSLKTSWYSFYFIIALMSLIWMWTLNPLQTSSKSKL